MSKTKDCLHWLAPAALHTQHFYYSIITLLHNRFPQREYEPIAHSSVYLQYLAQSRCSLNVCEMKCYPWFQSPTIFFILPLHHIPPSHFTILLQQKAPRAPLRSDILEHYRDLPHLPPHSVFWGVRFGGKVNIASWQGLIWLFSKTNLFSFWSWGG